MTTEDTGGNTENFRLCQPAGFRDVYNPPFVESIPKIGSRFRRSTHETRGASCAGYRSVAGDRSCLRAGAGAGGRNGRGGGAQSAETRPTGRADRGRGRQGGGFRHRRGGRRTGEVRDQVGAPAIREDRPPRKK